MLNPADDAFVATLADVLPQGTLRAAQPRDVEEPRGRWRGLGDVVAMPRHVDEVAAIVRACAAARVGIVPLGGGTGLVGGQVMPAAPAPVPAVAPVILSLERMAQIRAVYADEGVLEAEAGAILADVRAAAAAAGRLFPLALASQGSARIGGNLSTNAGGLNVLRYGNARDLCLGLEAVLPDGAIWRGLKRLRKDNTGYDLKNLLIGAEGTLGVITAASLRLFPQPARFGTAVMVVDTPLAAQKLLVMAESGYAGMVQAFELISPTGLEFLAETMPDLRVPFPAGAQWYALIELGLPESIDAEAALAQLFTQGMAAGLVSDGVIATSEAQRAGLWAVRESIPEANRRVGAISSHDISLPLGAVAEFIAITGPALARLGAWRINCFGHLGDGNLHYNVFPQRGGRRADHEDQRDAIKACVHDQVHDMGGSVSAEHGIGRLKVADLETYGDPAKLAAMRAIKAALDPAGIMNPGAVLRMT